MRMRSAEQYVRALPREPAESCVIELVDATCPECRGDGWDKDDAPCLTCGGDGYI